MQKKIKTFVIHNEFFKYFFQPLIFVPKIPRKPKMPRQPYIKPRIVGEKKRAELKRGELRFPERLKEETLKRTRARFLPTGEVRVPTWVGGKRRYVHAKDASAAIRMAEHQFKSISSEAKRLDSLYRDIQSIHSEAVRGWTHFNPAQKKATIQYISALAGSVVPSFGRLSAEDKLKAIARISEASKLLQKNNVSAAGARLVGAANDLIARKNTLLRQRQFISRRGRSIFLRKFIEDKRAFEHFDNLQRVFQELGALRKPQKFERESSLRQLSVIKASFGARREQAFKEAANQIMKAISQTKAGNFSQARAMLRRASKNISLELSKNTILFPERLELIKKSNDIAFKDRIASRQARYFHDNLVYWWEKARPEQKNNMVSYTRTLSGLFSSPGHAEAAEKAANALAQGRPEQAKERLSMVFQH